MSDQRLQRGIMEILKTRRIVGIEPLQVEVRRGIATIRGWVTTSFAKRVCYECTRRVTGVVRVIDEVQIAAS